MNQNYFSDSCYSNYSNYWKDAKVDVYIISYLAFKGQTAHISVRFWSFDLQRMFHLTSFFVTFVSESISPTPAREFVRGKSQIIVKVSMYLHMKCRNEYNILASVADNHL